MKKPSWLKNAYTSTTIHWGKTQAQIYKLLGELGIYEIRFTNLKERFALEFLVEVNETEKPRAIRIVVPLKHASKNDADRERELNIIHRILFNHLKAKFIAVTSGLTEFDSEFMSHLVLIDKNGKTATLGENILPQYKHSLESGNGGEIQLLN